jgi:AMMECR1 domain-containing protein
VVVPGHCVAALHCTQAPAALQTTPPWLHAASTGSTGCEGTPAVQTSLVHWLPSSAGTSLLSMAPTMLPTPSHWFFWQSPGVWALVAVPAAVLLTPQVLPAQVRVWHSVSVPAHWVGALHCTQAPPALHTVPLPWLQAVSTGLRGCEGTPAVQTSLVHWLPSSAGRSVLSAALTMLPAPSHWFFWQSPAAWALVRVPAGALLAPQVLPAQVRVWHSVSVPAHWVGALHCTQAPPALHTVPLPWLHAVSTGLRGCEGTPAVQTSLVHWLPSSAGRSVLSAALTMLPAPSHWFFWQSPAAWALVRVPAGALLAPQVLPAQVRVWHSVSVPAHWVGALHCTQAPPALHTVPLPWLHAVSTGLRGCEGTPAVQTSLVHWLPSSAGRSVLSAALTMLPAPSHWFFLQSPAVWALVAVPAGALLAPQALPAQVRVWHSVSAPAHWVAALHCTQVPAALHTVPPPWLHAVSTGLRGCEGTPAVQTSLVHGLPSSAGRSVLSMPLTMLPAPSHWFFWQSPAVWALVGVPVGALLTPQTLAVQVRA